MGNFGQRQLGSTSDVQLPDLRPHRLQCRGAHGWIESAEQRIVLRLLNQPRPKAVSEKVKLDVRILTFALSVLAVDDLGVRRMHFQTAFRQTCLKRGLDGLGFLARFGSEQVHHRHIDTMEGRGMSAPSRDQTRNA